MAVAAISARVSFGVESLAIAAANARSIEANMGMTPMPSLADIR